MFAASGWPKTPNTPHSSWNLSSSIGSLRTFSCTASPGERGERSVQGWHSPCNGARTRRSHGHFRTPAPAGPGRPPGRHPFADGGLRLASAHAGRQGSADRRSTHEAARALPEADARDALRGRRQAPGIGAGEPPRHAQAAGRPDRHQGMAGARPGTSSQRAAVQMGAGRRRRGRGAAPAGLEGLHRLAADQGRERLPLRHDLVEAGRALGGSAAVLSPRAGAAGRCRHPRDDPRVRRLHHKPAAGGGAQGRRPPRAHGGRPAAARRARRPGPRHHSAAVRLEGGEVGPSHRGAGARPARVLGAARVQQHRASMARRSLLLALALAVPAGAAPRQNVLEYVREKLARDRGFTPAQRAQLQKALEDRFANYGHNVVRPDKPQDVQTLMHVVAEGMFDQAPMDRIAEVAFAAYQAVWRGAPAEVVDGIALYGFRKPVPPDKLAAWANGYRVAVKGGVPDEVAADLVRNAMEHGWDVRGFDTVKWGLIDAARRKYDVKLYAAYVFAGMEKDPLHPGALLGTTRATFEDAARPAQPASAGYLVARSAPPARKARAS